MNDTTPLTAQSGAPGAATSQGAADGSQDTRALVPRVDVFEDEAGITLLADLPGVPKDKLELRIDGDRLLIEGLVTTVMPPQLQSVHAEVRVPRYRRTFTLSRELDAGRIEANVKDGVLTLRIPRQEHAKPRRIEVRAG